jgi:tRNA pseudouridine32 synthase/23S rRNA pseudouridine746 synthase
MIKTEYHISIKQEKLTAIEWLATAMRKERLSRNALKAAMQKGCVWIETKDAQGQQYTQRLRRAKKVLKKGDTLHCYYDEKVLGTEPATAILISDEGDYSIWNKPAGMLSQGSKWGDHCTIYRWAEQHLQPERPAFIVHRLDRAASGLIILAHKKQLAAKFSEMFQQRLIQKHYQVSVKGDFSQIVPKDKSQLTVNDKLDGKTAVSHFSLLNYNGLDDISLLKVNIETGRKHQIRKHLSMLAYPVIGDRLYGTTLDQNTISDITDKGSKLINNIKAPHEALQLIATSLSFDCPITQQKKVYKIDICQC